MRGTVLSWLRRRLQTGVALAGLVLLAGVTCSLTIGVALHRNDARSAAQLMDRRTAAAQAAVSAEVTRYVDLAEEVAAAVRAGPDLTSARFDTITAPLAHQGLSGAAAVTFVVAVDDGGVAAAQAYWRAHGAPDLTLHPSGTGHDHIFAVLNRSLTGRRIGVLGMDASAARQPAAAFQTAARTGRPVISQPYQLLRDRALPAAQRQLSFALVVPVPGEEAAGTGRIRGWIGMGLRGQDFLGASMRHAAEGTLDVELRAGGRLVSALHQVPGHHDLRRDVTVAVAGQQWGLRTETTLAQLPATPHLGDAAAVVGLILTVLLTGLVFVLSTARTVAEERVREATAGARAARDEAARQAGLLGAVMTSIGDGVGVVDGEGRFLLHNPAAKRMLGVEDDIDGPSGWTEHYGLLRPDGTPYPPADLPLVRALRGEECDGTQILVRNPARPDGVWLSVSARPLDPAAGQPGAVAVFHDITERKQAEADLAALNAGLEERVRERTVQLEAKAAALREVNDELEAFSYSVSHDLRAPLRAVNGFATIVRDEYGGSLPAEARRYLDKVIAGAVRMGQLIDGLLAFSRTQRQELAPQEVHLDAVVADVWDELAPDRADRDVELVVGDLPACEGDPRLLRHVVANLLGNAVKYSRNRAVARVEVGGTDSDGYVTYRVRDNGAGFDMRYADKLFKVFQRLHREDEYEGTGIGLALSQRIVHRHGGRIWAESVPGEGSTFFFTLGERAIR